MISFFFPFLVIKCEGPGGQSVKFTKSGVSMMTGVELNAKDFHADEEDFEAMKIEPNLWVLLSFLAGIGGAIVIFMKQVRRKVLGSLIVGIVGILGLIMYYIELKDEGPSVAGDMLGMTGITIGVGIGFYLCFLGYAALAGFSGFLMSKGENFEVQEGSPDDVLEDV